tara:strand:+ start:1168 stop:2199 length:1032 start_codon:yes stop_codon:yes gene_type:complete
MGQLVQLQKNNKDFDYYLTLLKKLCNNDLQSINSIIIEKLDSNVPLIQEIASHLILSGGKRLRPLLTSCCFKICKQKLNHNDKDYLGLAAAVEFIHAATLLHDDVVDKSKKRRGSPTANEIWGNKTSVLVGDFLFSRAFQLMTKYGNQEMLKILSDTSVTISEGEILELSNDKDPTISENTYFEVINGKTASLFSAACQMGAISSKTTNEKIDALKYFGTNFGMSFQLIDDAIDYSSSSFDLGKNIGDDFKEGKVTLPIILAYLRSNNSEKKFWKKTIQDLKQDNNDFENAIEIIKKYNCIDDTIERARHFANIAKDSLGVFENNEFKKILLNIIDSGLERIK